MKSRLFFGFAGRVPGLVLVFAFCLFARLAQAEEPSGSLFTMAFGFSPAENSQYAFLSALYSEVFDRLGMTFAYEILPLRRCSVDANAGLYDGEPLRVASYADSYPDMIVVSERVFVNHIAVYALYDAPVTDWNSLAAGGYAVDYVSGSVQIEKNLFASVGKDHMTAVQSPEKGLTMLLLGRADLFIDLESRVEDALSSSKFSDSGIRQLCIIDSNEGFPVVHKKNAALAPRIAEALRSIKRDGTYDDLMRTLLSKDYEKYYSEQAEAAVKN